MSNIRKSFNFRDGVQVDDDIFIVRGSLVGIGTSVPTERLDVRGDVKVVGLTSSVSIQSEYNLVTGVSSATRIFVGITSINSGIITATSQSGIVTYYGDGGRLLNLPTSQWLDVDVGLGFTSIYAQGYVGIATFDPRFVFQVGGNADTTVAGFRRGVGLSSAGDILATGFVTAYSYVGFGTGLTNLNATQLTDGTVNNARLPNTISINNFVGAGISVSVGGTFGNVSISTGIITATTGILTYYGDGSPLTNLNASNISSGTLSNSRLPSNISISGILTATSGLVGNVTGNVTGNVLGNVTGIASTARSLTGTPDIIVGYTTATRALSVGGTAYVSEYVWAETGLITRGSHAAGVSTISSFINVENTANPGIGVTLSFSGTIGVGTNNPLFPIHIRKPTNAEINITSDDGQARIAVGQSVGIGNSSAVFRFGNAPRTLDIINNSFGPINFILNGGTVASPANQGGFSWVYGPTTDTIMSLSYTGNLSIDGNFTNAGIITSGTNTFVGSQLFVNGPITFGTGSTKYTLGSLSGAAQVLPNINLNVTSGISTVSQLHVTGIGSIGIGTNRPVTGLDAGQVNGIINTLGVGTERTTDLYEDFHVFGTSAFSQSIGVGTDKIYQGDEENGGLQLFNAPMKIYNNALLFGGELGGIGIMTDSPIAAIDMSLAMGFLGERTTFLPPVLTTTERNNLSFVPEGAMIYNTTLNKHQGYDGTTWKDFY